MLKKKRCKHIFKIPYNLFKTNNSFKDFKYIKYIKEKCLFLFKPIITNENLIISLNLSKIQIKKKYLIEMKWKKFILKIKLKKKSYKNCKFYK